MVTAFVEIKLIISTLPSAKNVTHRYQNEKLNGRMRDEHLNRQPFDSLFEAQVLTEG